jgi:hypothetical protein
MDMEQEKLPVHEVIKILEVRQVYKTEKWWQAAVLGEAFNKRFVALYLWQKKGDRWKQVHKLKVNNKRNWEQIRPLMDELVAKL